MGMMESLAQLREEKDTAVTLLAGLLDEVEALAERADAGAA